MSSRWEAIQELARGGENWRSWMLREAVRGTPMQQRALLLCLALDGSEEGLAVIRRVARPGSRADPERSWALLLRGAFDPVASTDAPALLKKLSLPFDRDCFLVGLLGQATSCPDLHAFLPTRRRGPSEHAAVLHVLNALSGRAVSLPDKEASAPHLAAGLIVSILDGVGSWPTARLQDPTFQSLDPVWIQAARRDPPRGLKDLQQSGIGAGSGAFAMVMHEVDPARVGMVFDYLEERLSDPRARRWLFGAAGDRGWAPPFPESPWEDARAGGLLRLALHDPTTAAGAAAAARSAARKYLVSQPNLLISWPAAAVLALAPEEEDLVWLRQRTEGAEGSKAERMHFIWQLASGRADVRGRGKLLRAWSRELGMGRTDFFAHQLGRWAVLYLTSGSLATEDSMDWARFADPFQQKRPHPPGHGLWLDLLWVLEKDFPWDLRSLRVP